jgi:hypothetical protein
VCLQRRVTLEFAAWTCRRVLCAAYSGRVCVLILTTRAGDGPVWGSILHGVSMCGVIGLKHLQGTLCFVAAGICATGELRRQELEVELVLL